MNIKKTKYSLTFKGILAHFGFSNNLQTILLLSKSIQNINPEQYCFYLRIKLKHSDVNIKFIPMT